MNKKFLYKLYEIKGYLLESIKHIEKNNNVSETLNALNKEIVITGLKKYIKELENGNL